MNHGDVPDHCNHPQYGGHAVEQCAYDHQHDSLWTLHEADLALLDHVFGTCPCVADHQRSAHHQRGQHDIEEAVGSRVVNQQPKIERNVAIAIDDGIEEPAKM